jgi:hypothetical protein
MFEEMYIKFYNCNYLKVNHYSFFKKLLTKSFFIFSLLLIKMSSLSLDASIRTCKVETGQASRVLSDRFLNPNNMVCIPWNGFNSKGQSICQDSFQTKTPGCNSADDRVAVENSLRPQYADYINLNVAGLQGNIYGNTSAWEKSGSANKYQDSRNQISGNFGTQWGANVYQTCSGNAYERSMAQEAQAKREGGAMANAYRSAGFR